jgi:hypothetical protein
MRIWEILQQKLKKDKKLAIAIARKAFMWTHMGRRRPWYVIVHGRTPVTVHPGRIVFTHASQWAIARLTAALRCMTIAFAPCTDRNVRYGIIIGLEHLFVVEYLVAERV